MQDTIFSRLFSSNILNAKKLWSGIKSSIAHKDLISNRINEVRDKNRNMTSNSAEISINVADNVAKAIPRASKALIDYSKALTLTPCSFHQLQNMKLKM